MRDEQTEPAIQVIAPIPVQSIRDLMHLADRDFGGLDRPGVRVAFDITRQGDLRVAGVVKVHDVEGALLAERTYDGRWRAGVFVQWTKRE